jgi:MFS transporter, putative metabolite:H+ symporter
MQSIGPRIERIPDNGYNMKLLLQTGLGYIYDNLDGTLLSFVLPVVAGTGVWALSSAQTGLLGSSLFFGYFFGTLCAGYFGDRHGRKTMIMLTLIIYCIGTLISALATSWTFFFWARVVAGFGTGGEAAIIAPYLSEMIASKYRGRYTGMLTGFFSIGNILAALLSYFVIAQFQNGWRIAIFVSALPILMVIVWRRYLPESPRWLEQVGRVDEANRIMQQIEGQAEKYLQQKLPEPTATVEHVQTEEKLRGKDLFAMLFTKRFLNRTIMLWIVWFAMIYTNFGFLTWLPSLLVKQGYSIAHTFLYSLIIYVAQVPGYALGSWLCDKLGRKSTLIAAMVCAMLSAFAMGHANTAILVVLFGAGMSMFMSTGFAILYTYTPEQYPTTIRATGMGTASAISRIGGILAPIIIGYIYPQYAFPGVFTMLTAVIFVGAVVLLVLGTETKAKPLDDSMTDVIQPIPEQSLSIESQQEL